MNQARYYLLGKIFLTLSTLCFVWTNTIGLNIAIAAPNWQPEPAIETMVSHQTDLPPEIEKVVLEEAAQQTNRSVTALRVLEAQPQDWPDSCLGLAEPDELCAQVITPGWQVVVTDGQNNWIYRTNSSDRVNVRQLKP